MPIAITGGKKLKTDARMQKAGIPVENRSKCWRPYPFRDRFATVMLFESMWKRPDTTAVWRLPLHSMSSRYFILAITVRSSGPGPVHCMPDHLQQLDYELEVAVVICRSGKNIKAADADEYIGGLMIMNDFSARRLQMEEMKLSLGPAKGKDFATALGPWLVTLDELEYPIFSVPPPAGSYRKVLGF